MNLESQVVSLELAKELKELGYKQEGLWWWEHHIFSGRDHRRPDSIILRLEKDTKFCDGKRVELKNDVYQKTYCAAPTVAELGERLPQGIKTARYITNDKEYYLCWGTKIHQKQFSEKTEANARAKMWLYLEKNNKI